MEDRKTVRTHEYQHDVTSPVVREFCDDPDCTLPHELTEVEEKHDE